MFLTRIGENSKLVVNEDPIVDLINTKILDYQSKKILKHLDEIKIIDLIIMM